MLRAIQQASKVSLVPGLHPPQADVLPFTLVLVPVVQLEKIFSAVLVLKASENKGAPGLGWEVPLK